MMVMSLNITKVFLAAALVLTISLGVVPTARAYTVEPGHPRVDIRPPEVSAIASRAYGSNSEEYDHLKSWCNAHINDSISSFPAIELGYRMEAFAFVYLIEKERGNPQRFIYSDHAKALMSRLQPPLGISGHEPKRAFARAFDWMYDVFSASEKSACVAKLETMVDETVALTFQSGTHSISLANSPLVHLGLALYDDNQTKARESLDRARWWFIDTNNQYRVIDNWDETAGDGAQFAGNYAYHVGMRGLAEWLHAWDKGTSGEDQASRFDHMKNSGLFYSYAALPSFTGQPLGDGTFSVKNWEAGAGLYICSSLYDDGRARYMAEQSTRSWINQTHWRYTLWNNKSIPLQSPGDLDKAHFFDSLGVVYLRSGWDLTSGSDDIISSFRCSKRSDWHTHCDQASFEIWRGTDYLAVDSGAPDVRKGGDPPGEHFMDYYIRTVAHNSMLIYNPNEQFDMASYGICKNDGGQQWVNRDGPWAFGSRLPGGENSRGFIERYHDAANYTYSLGDATSSYSSTGNDQGQNTKISNFTRQYIYLKDRFFVVLDRVNSLDDPPATVFVKSWLLHSISMPEIEDGGSWSMGATPNGFDGTPGTTSPDTNVLSVTRGDSKLYVNIVYPIEHTVTKVGGPSTGGAYNTAGSYEFYHHGSNNYSASTTPVEKDGRWRIEVSPSGSDIRRDNVFLNVLEPVDATAPRTQVQRIQDQVNGFYGVYIGDSNSPWLVMCSNEEQLKQAVSYTISASGQVKHLICDLATGSGQYNVYKNAQLLPGAPYPVTNANTLYFETDGGGNFMISEGPPPVDDNPPSGTISINGGAARTASNAVMLSLSATDDISGMGPGAQMQFSNDGSTWSSPESYSTVKSWMLLDVNPGEAQTCTVRVKFKDAAGNWSGAKSDSIILDKEPPQPPAGLTVGE